jgi:D-alanine-D-alanine ligase
MIDEDGGPVFLEVNTLPGLKEMSLLPMSARCEGMDFPALLVRMITPAISRFQHARENPLAGSNQS